MAHDETFFRAAKFMDVMQNTHPGLSNIYVLTLKDENDNIIDEKFGMNLMTNYGFKTLYQIGTSKFEASDSVKLYVGEGTNGVTLTSQKIDSPLFGGLAATNTNTTRAYNYPIYYAASDTEGYGIITLINRFLICEYPVNIANYPDEYRITEFGIGTGVNNIWTHSRVYSDDGKPSSMLKIPNTKLVFTVYMCLSFYEKLIQNGWVDNIYTVFTTNSIMHHRMFEDNTYTYKRNGYLQSRGTCSNPFQTSIDSYHTLSTTDDNSFTNSTIIPPITMYDGGNTASGYFDGFAYKQGGLLIIEPQYLDHREDVDIVDIYSYDPGTYDGFSTNFGLQPSNESDYKNNKHIPITHVIDPHVYLFNYKNNEYDNEIRCHQDSRRVYDDTPNSTTCAMPLYYVNKGEILTGYVYQNIYQDDPILKIKSGGLTIYATNKYWVNSESEPWIWIQDLNNVPKAAQKCRYWITNSNTTQLIFGRESDEFFLYKDDTTNDTGYRKYPTFSGYGIYPYVDNEAYGWFIRGGNIYIPDLEKTLTLGSSEGSTTAVFTYGKWLVKIDANLGTKIYVSDMTNAKTKGTIETQNVQLPFEKELGGTNAIFAETYRTETETGIFVIDAISTDETVILDLRGDTVKTVLKNEWKHACCVWGTNKIAYLNSENKLCIYNMDTESLDGDPVEVPATDAKMLFGHTKYVWITDGGNFGYVVDISSNGTRTFEPYQNDIKYTNSFNQVRFTCVDDYFIIYKYTQLGENDRSKNFYIKLSEPKIPRPMSEIYSWNNQDLHDMIQYKLKKIATKTDANGIEKSTLVLLVTIGYRTSVSYKMGSYNSVIDFGKTVFTKSSCYSHWALNEKPNWCWYGSDIFVYLNDRYPVQNRLSIRLKCKTDTVTALNKIKNISGKQYMISYTNLPVWGDTTDNDRGVPPGKPIASTTKDGSITGWS